MKTKIPIIIFFLITIINSVFISVIYCQPNSGSVFETINIPSSNSDGINPEDIIYANDKFFVWGLGAVLVIDAEDFSVLNTLTLSASAQFDYNSLGPILNNPVHSKLVYDGNQKIFALSADNEIYIINTNGNGSLINYKIEKPENVPDYHFENSIIRYDYKNKLLIWSNSWQDNNGITHTHIECYDVKNDEPTLKWPYPYDATNEWINDIVINKNSDYFYLSSSYNTIKVCSSNTGSFIVVRTINTSGPNGTMLYIPSNEYNDLHRIYCNSYNRCYWIDGDHSESSYYDGSFPTEETNLKCLAYCPQTDKLYLSSSKDAQIGSTNLYIYNGSVPQGSLITTSLDIHGNDENCNYMEYFDGKVYACKSSEIVDIDVSNNSVSTVTPMQKSNNFFYSAALDPNRDHLLFCNTNGSSVDIYSTPESYIDNIVTGVSVFKSAYNPTDRKFYFYSDGIHDGSRLTIVNFNNSTNSYDIDDVIGFEHNISSCVYNPNSTAHHLLISSYGPTHQIMKLDAATNESDNTLNTDNEYCENIYISPEPNNRIYCATGMNSLQSATIEIFHANDYSEDFPLPDLGQNNQPIDYRIKFCYDTKDDFVFFVLFKRNYNPQPGYQWGYLGKIDVNDEQHPLTLIELDYSPKDIVYNKGYNRIFIQNSESPILTSFDCNDINIPPSYDEFPTGIITDIESTTPETNSQIYVLGSNGNCYRYSGPGNPPFYTIYELSQWVTSMKWNPFDNKLYVFSPWNSDENHESWMFKINLESETIYGYQMPNNSIWRYVDNLPKNEMVVDSYSGRILCPNGSHSNISVSSEAISLNANKWNWLSFPRLDRSSGNPAPEQVLAQENFSYPYTSLEMDHLETARDNEYMTTVTWDVEHLWQYYFLDRIHSEKGYKLHLDPVLGRSLDTYGTVLDPQTPLTLYGGKHNWVGYFLPYPQNPFDAIPRSITDNLYSMVSQYWSCYNYALIQPPPPTKSTATSAQWRCACNQLKMELKYGDMVILHSKPQQTFIWNQAGADPQLINKNAPEHFEFEEKADYTSYFIELDTNNLADEIGVFAGDSCIGATKVLSSDTTVLICAYDKGFEGQDITFQTFWQTKSYRPIIKDYLVLNTMTGIREKQRIVAGDKQPFYVISFKDKPENQTVSTDAWLALWPNPASHEVLLSYFIPERAYVTVRISGIVEGDWSSINRGYQDPGEYKLNINSLQLPAGCYLVILCFNNKSITEKLMILK
jgi:hypothetical protein